MIDFDDSYLNILMILAMLINIYEQFEFQAEKKSFITSGPEPCPFVFITNHENKSV